MLARPYDHERDKDAAHRIWREIGWLGTEANALESMDVWVTAGDARVAEVDGAAECLVLSAPGTVRYMDTDLAFWGVTGVTTSRIVRKQGLATRLTAQAIADGAAGGAAVAGLGMFEQGFYDRLGMGTGSYENWCTFDPARLRVDGRPRIPRRFTIEDSAALHAARLSRLKSHGAVTMTAEAYTRGEMMEDSGKSFGLGYCDGPDGAPSHFIWFRADSAGHGPYGASFYAYQTMEQFLDLMRMVKALGDQVDRISMAEPAGVQMQDLIEWPFHQARVTRQTRFETGVRATAGWQCRILDLERCVGELRLPAGTLEFNLQLDDPIERYLEGYAWHGIGGEYRVRLGQESCVQSGCDPALPTLKASAGAFSRLWLGSATARGLSITDRLSGPSALLEDLDRSLRLPRPLLDWPL